MTDHYLHSVHDVLRALNSSEAGLSDDEAASRLAKNGRNELAKAKTKSLPRRFFEQLLNPMVLVLLAAAAVSVAIAVAEGGNANEFAEAGIILAVVIINSVLGVYQESKAEKAIEALQEMSAATAKVRRGGAVIRVPSSELAVGDVVLLEAGDAVPADIRLIQCASLKIEEAALTGESVPVNKRTDALTGDDRGGVSLGDRRNMAYMGSSVAYGRGEGVVAAVGMDTEMGKIAGVIQAAEDEETPLQKRLSSLSKILSILVLAICAVVFAVRLISEGEFGAEGILSSFMLAVSLAVAAIPEGLAAVVTIVLSIGVTNMAKKNAIIRRLTAVETLGCAQIICSDKTGTLTQNKMTVVESYGDKDLLVKGMALCSDSQLGSDGEIVGDPTENALVAFALKEGFNKNELSLKYPRAAEAPFDSTRKMMTTINAHDGGFIQFTKGAPDEILRRCTHALDNGHVAPLTPDRLHGILARNKRFADRALRSLALAYREMDTLPADIEPEAIERSLIFVGIEAMIDPVRPEVKAAVDTCRNAGVSVVMITGDHRDTAVAIAKELGVIDDPSQAITGRDLDDMTDEEFERRIEQIHVYARVQPEHKVRIVNMWKRKGRVTAMTGDGVNDAPAIKSGDIGVGMGITGTDVTKNVADMVLADDNFATIVAAVAEGRRIYDNIRKTIQFLLSSNLSEVVSIFIATIIGFTLFKPVHLLFINLITDSLPAVALGMEDAQDGIMRRPPRGQNEGVFAGGLGIDVVYQGVLIALITIASYLIVDVWHGHGGATTSAFFTMSMCEIFHSYNMRSQRGGIFRLKRGNKALLAAMMLSLALTLTVIYVPFLANVFALEPLSFRELAVALGLSVSVIPIVEAVKAVQRRFS
ncbi:MAG: calcium-translocating P-type ATPase, PMCA-type [Oscillospiraceae bacterium]|jgi:Ca2+-transporting ATPase|nr:calcium-translocating P-type ATPase, PMCA-type [Oscillospiraceae bacterium]